MESSIDQLASSLKMLHLISLNIMDITVASITMTHLHPRCKICGHFADVSSLKAVTQEEQIFSPLEIKCVEVSPNKAKREALPKDDTNVAIQQRQQEEKCCF